MKRATHLLMVVDHSTSMELVKVEAETAINEFLKTQRDDEEECTLTLVEFCSPHLVYDGGAYVEKKGDEWFRMVYDGPIKESPDYILKPKGSTALLDAIGRACDGLGERLGGLDEDQRPDNVIVVVQTDGQENASTKYAKDQIQTLIEEQTNKYNWSFIFLGMGPDTWAMGEALGFSNNLRASGSAQSYGGTYDVLTASVSSSRMSGQSVSGLDEDIK